jgi:hypothetical protein
MLIMRSKSAEKAKQAQFVHRLVQEVSFDFLRKFANSGNTLYSEILSHLRIGFLKL